MKYLILVLLVSGCALPQYNSSTSPNGSSDEERCKAERRKILLRTDNLGDGVQAGNAVYRVCMESRGYTRQ